MIARADTIFDQVRLDRALLSLQMVAEGDENLMEPIMEAVCAYRAVGEIVKGCTGVRYVRCAYGNLKFFDVQWREEVSVSCNQMERLIHLRMALILPVHV